IYLTDPNTYRIYLQQQIAHYNGNGLGFSFGSSLSYQVGYFLVGINYGYIKANIPTSGEKMKFFGMNRELTYEYTPKFEFDGNYIGVEAKYKFGEPVEEPLTSLICKIKTSKMSVEENLTFLVFNHTAYNLKKKEYIISLLGFEYGWTDQIQIGGRGGIELSFSRDSFLEIGQNWTYIKVNEETLRWVISLMLYRKMDSLLVIRERRSDDSYRSSSFDMYDSYGYQVAVARKLGSITVFHTGIGNLGFFAGLEKKLSKSSRRLLLEISNNSNLNVWSTGIALYFHPKKTYKYKLGLGSFLFEKKIHISPIIHFYWKF
ncbi:MAG TPA: hypothetical protein DHV62_05945, partial [Elusimicrobia bacterium]|nr:hypothetical protein [Elusimicrobiota bacterium]